MNKLLSCVLLLFIGNHSFSQTQFELNEAENNKFLKADKELNQVYLQVLKDYKSDTAFIRNLKSSQRLWIQFRDAEMKVMYPERELGYYGSIHPMCWSIYKTELTHERTKKLRTWLTGLKEGEPCSIPSIKVKE